MFGVLPYCNRGKCESLDFVCVWLGKTTAGLCPTFRQPTRIFKRFPDRALTRLVAFATAMAGFSQRGPLFRSEGVSATPQERGVAETTGADKSCHGGTLPAWVRARPPTKINPAPRTVVKPGTPASNRCQDEKGVHSGQLLTVGDTASFFQVSEKTIRRMIARGELPFVRIGRSIRIDPEAIETIARQNE
jgi:excisionase family DNA binding protein